MYILYINISNIMLIVDCQYLNHICSCVSLSRPHNKKESSFGAAKMGEVFFRGGGCSVWEP